MCAFADYEWTSDDPPQIKWFKACEQQLTDPSWKQVKGQIAHICGEKPAAARYDASMTPKERDVYDNLILLCPTCHVDVDRLRPDHFTVEILRLMKERAASKANTSWASDEQIELFVQLSIQSEALDGTLATGPSPQTIRPAGIPSDEAVGLPTITQKGGRPRLVLVRMNDRVIVRNSGDADARSPQVLPDDVAKQLVVESADIAPPLVSPDGEWEYGIVASTYGQSSPGSIELRWSDSAGTPYSATFPVSP